MRPARRVLVVFCVLGLLYAVLMQWWIPAGIFTFGLICAGISRD